MSFDYLEPFGPVVDDFHSARLASIILNALQGKKGKTYRPQNLMLSDFTALLGEPKKQDPKEILEAFKSMGFKKGRRKRGGKKKRNQRK